MSSFARSLRSTLALAVLVATPVPAAAQHIPTTFDLHWEEERADAAYVRDVGAGLFLSGVALTGAGTAIMFGIDGGFEGWAQFIGGGLLTGIGGVLGLVGLPTWIAGGVRADILSSHDDLGRARTGWDWRVAGVTVFAIGMGLATLGAITSAIAIATRNVPEELLATAFVVIPVGSFAALFVGAPMWAEGARF